VSKIVAIAGLGDESTAPSGHTMLAWGIVVGLTVGIFIGTLALNPSKKRRS